jgi:hypothetical protein
MISRSLPSFVLLLLTVAALPAQELAKPQAQHRRLAQSVGTWDAAIQTVGGDGALHGSKGVSVQTQGPGGFWILDDFQGEMNGVRFTGHGAIGYDPQRKVYVQSWVSMTPMLMVLTGAFDEAGKVLTMTGEGPGLDGAPVRMKNVTTWTGVDSRTLEVFVVLPDGTERKSMTITYTRRTQQRTDKTAGKT